MAVVNYTEIKEDTFGNNVRIVSWLNLAKGDTGQPYSMPGWQDRSIQIEGAFDSANATFKGSNDGTTYYVLTDPQGNAISKTAAALEEITEMTRYVRPEVDGSGGSAAVDFILAVRWG
jgi:hypothetical protein